MHTTKLPAAATAVLAATTASVLLAGCSFNASVTGDLPADELANTVAEKLAATTGQPKPDVTCPEDLAAEVDTTTRCTLTAGDGSTLGITVTVTSVEGTDINFDIKADDQPTPAQN